MTATLNDILIFKTNISTAEELYAVKSLLDRHPHIHSWSIDQQDIDCVLRVVTPKLGAVEIIQFINGNGFDCSELE